MQSRSDKDPKRQFRWGFGSAFLVVCLLTFTGWGLINLLLPYFMAGKDAILGMGGGRGLADAPRLYAERHLNGPRDWMREVAFLAFLVVGAYWVRSQWSAVNRFFRSMTVGVTLVSMATVAVAIGVMIPQIDPPDDADLRVTEANREEQYQAFRWAQGYFLWHLSHLYGVGMPQVELPPQTRAGLERFGIRYGFEERDNRRKQMQASFSGGAKTQAIQAFIERNESFLERYFEWCTRLHFNRIYRTHYFASLLSLVFIAVAFNTFHGGPQRWFKPTKLGFFLTHLGMLTLLVGGGVSRSCTDRGILHLFLDGDVSGDGVADISPVQDTYWRHFRPDKLSRMPFGVSLEHFNRRDWKSLRVHFLEEEFTARIPDYTLWKGRTIDLDYRLVDRDGNPLRLGTDGKVRDQAGDEVPDRAVRKIPNLRLRVLGLHDRARVEGIELTETWDPSEPLRVHPVVELIVPDLEALVASGGANGIEGATRAVTLSPRVSQLFPNRLYADPYGSWRLLATYGGDTARAFPREDDGLGWVQVSLETLGEQATRVVPLRPGVPQELPGGFLLTAEKVTADFRVEGPETFHFDQRPLAEQEYRTAAAWLQIEGPDGRRERRLVVEGLDAQAHGLQGGFEFPELYLRMGWNPWTAPGPPRFLLHWNPGEGPRLIGEDGSVVPVMSGERLALPGNWPTRLGRYFHRARVEPSIAFEAPRLTDDGWDKDFYSRDPRGLELEVTFDPTGPEPRVEVLRLASTRESSADVWFSDDRDGKGFALEFFENTEMLPFEWRSVLAIHSLQRDGSWRRVETGPEQAREIRVNEYLTHRGYRFFQTNALPDNPRYSGIGVVYDPGIPIVLVGMYLVIAGATVAFLVRPIVQGRSRRPQGVVSSSPPPAPSART